VNAGAGETTIAVRVSDAYENQAVAKTVSQIGTRPATLGGVALQLQGVRKALAT